MLGAAPDPERLARAWIEGIHRAAPAGPNPGTLLDRVYALLAAMWAEPVDAAGLAALGASLVDDRLTDVAALESSLTALGHELTDPSGAPVPPDRVHQVLASIAAGYAEGLRTLALREQQNIIESAMAARVSAEQARWDAEARFEAIFTESAVGIGIVDLDGRIVEVNPAICRMLGHRPDQVRGQRIADFDFDDPDDAADLHRQIRGLLAGSAEHLRLQMPYRQGNGTPVWVDLVLSPVRDRQGRPRYIVGMAVDITARRDLAKAAGGSRYAVFQAEHHPREMSRFAMSGRLPQALARGEFIVEFEPIVRLADDRVVGAAAVVHWQLPSGERIPAEHFMPVAVESGLIVPLGQELIRQACAQSGHWRPTPDALVSVDLTARQLREPGFVDDLAAILRTSGAPPAACSCAWVDPNSPPSTPPTRSCCGGRPSSACGSPSTTSGSPGPSWTTCADCRCARSPWRRRWAPTGPSRGRPVGRRPRCWRPSSGWPTCWT